VHASTPAALSSDERVATPTKFGEVFTATVGVAIWAAIAIQQGLDVGLKYSWLLLTALALGAWALLMRLRYTSDRLAMTIGPWRRRVDLNSLDSISWKMTGAWRSQGTILVRDRNGGEVPIYVGRFNRENEWGPLLLDAANRCEAQVDHRSRQLLHV
jgi:hypothetical protein